MASRNWLVQKEHIYLSASGKRVLARAYIPGHGMREISLGAADTFKSDESLIRARNKKVAELVRLGRKKSAELVRFDELVKEILHIKSAKAHATYVSFEVRTRMHLIPWLNRNCPYVSQFNETIWERYIVDQYKRRGRCKLFDDRKALVTILTHATKRGVFTRAVKLRNPDSRTKAGKVYSEDEIARLIINAGEILKIQILMAYLMGMRRIEILSLEWSDVHFESRTLTIQPEKTKTRIGRTIGVHPHILQELDTLSRVSPYVFPSATNAKKHVRDNKTAWRACKKKAAVKGRFHDLRHTFLTNAFHQAKLPPQDVCAYAGLNLIVAQRVYLHPTAESTRVVSLFTQVPIVGQMVGQKK